MKKGILYKYYAIITFAIVTISFFGCNEAVFDFGYNGQLSGKVIDSTNGNIVSGNNQHTDFAVEARGEKDITSIILRVNGDGTYRNTKLYPQSYEVWLEGPFVEGEGKTQSVSVDLTNGEQVVHDFTVTPLLSISAPSISGNVTSTEISVNYAISGNEGNTPDIMEIYCSTVSWPTRNTGSGYRYSTETIELSENEGTATFSGLQPNTKYYIRIGAKASGQDLFNHSEQISATTTQ